MSFELSERQQSAATAAITILSAAVIVVGTATVLWLIGMFVNRFSNVLFPLLVAAVAALVFDPYYEWLNQKARLPPVVAVVAVFLSAIIPLTAFFWFVGDLLVAQAIELGHRFPAWWESVRQWSAEQWPEVVQFFQEHPLGQRIRAAATDNAATVLGGVQTVSSKIFSAGANVVQWIFGLLSWVVVPVYFAFFLMTKPSVSRLEGVLPFLKQETRDDVIYLVEEFVNIIVAFFRGQLLVAFLQGLLFAIGFSIVGLKYGFLIGLVLGFLNIIPYLGSIVGLAVALPLSFFQTDGGLTKLIGVILVFTAVQMIEGYLLTPKIMGDRTGLHPMVIIFAIFFWGSALSGIMGMILAIPLTAFLVVFWRLAQEKYVQEIV